MSDAPRCTMTFATDIRDYPSNPHKARTPFGFPQTVSVGDAFAELEALTTRAEAAEAEVKRLREALNLIDALDPEGQVYSCSADALRGLVLRMGEIARKAYEEAGRRPAGETRENQKDGASHD